MKSWSFYHQETGVFHQQTVFCRDDHLSFNTPIDFIAIEGAYDPLSQRMDIGTGSIIDYQPPRPSELHEWDVGLKRWVHVQSKSEVCATMRRAEYPPLSDLADAIYWKAHGDDSKMTDYIARCAEVKKKYPKP